MILPLSAIANFVSLFLIQGSSDFSSFEIRESRKEVIIILRKSEIYNYKYMEGKDYENKYGLKRLDKYNLK